MQEFTPAFFSCMFFTYSAQPVSVADDVNSPTPLPLPPFFDYDYH